MTLSPKPGLLDIALYVGGRSAVPGVEKVTKLSSNESPVGPSPRAVEALVAAAHDLQLYPDGNSLALRQAIGAAHDLDPARIIVGGEGSGPLLTLLANAYLQPGDEVIFSRHAFLIYEIATLANSAKPVIVAEKKTNTGIKIDVAAMLAAVTPKTRMLYIANPNNPTGSYLTRDEMAALHAGLPDDVLLVIDAAYGEYVPHADYDTGSELVSRHDNVVMTRTFSKLYGLAALRLGWMFAPQAVCDAINRIRGPFNTSSFQQAAGAAAVRDRGHVAMAAEHNSKWLDWVTAEIRKTGLRVDDSVANFVLIHFSPGAGGAHENKPGKTAAAADAFLTQNGVILRGVAAYGLPDCLRMTIGTEEQNRLAVSLIQKFMAS
jgi:histidinol-phosphate aminotransferase